MGEVMTPRSSGLEGNCRGAFNRGRVVHISLEG